MSSPAFDFYRWVLPAGYIYGAYTTAGKTKNPQSKDGKWLNHKAFDNHADMASWAAARAESTEATYFALAAFIAETKPIQRKDGSIWNKPDRTQANVRALKSLWADIDCGPGKPYPNKKAAYAAIQERLNEKSLPVPSIVVDSGNGVHLYWCMTEEVPVSEWTPVAHGFREHMQNLGLGIDAGVTIDSARILRAPGTLNCKDPSNPQDVRVLRHTGLHDWSTFVHYGAKGVGPVPGFDASGLASTLAGGTLEVLARVNNPSGAFRMEHIAAECPQIAAMAANGGADCDEPLWRGMLLLAARCEDGDTWAHKLSEGHPDYDPAVTDSKLQAQRDVLAEDKAGPTNCSYFLARRPALCGGCRHLPRVRAGERGIPLRFGRPLGDLPAGFEELPNGSMQRTIREQDPESGEWVEERHVFLKFPIRNFAVIDVDGSPERHYRFEAHRTHGRMQVLAMPASTVRASPLAVFGALSKHGLDVSDPLNAKHVADFMKAWAELLEETQGVPEGANRVGYTADGNFRLGDLEISPTGRVSRPTLAALQLRQYIGVSGSYDVWRQAANAMLNAPIELLALVAVSFGSPLAQLVDFNGFAFSFHSKESGVGKSTAIRLGASVYGDPAKLPFSLDDTDKSVVHRIGMMPNLPAYWDEVRFTGDDREMAKRITMLFQLAQGRERTRLSSSIELRDAKDWKTLMAIGTNERLLDLVALTREAPDPVFARMLEIDVPVAVDTSASASAPFRALATNFGHAGPDLIQFVLGRREKVAEQVLTTADTFRNVLKLDSSTHRFWTVASALTLVGAACAKKAGIMDFPLGALQNRLALAMTSSARTQASVANDAGDLLGRFLDWFFSDPTTWLVTENGKSKMLPDPRKGAKYHLDLTSGVGLMSFPAFEAECRKRKVSPYRALEAMGTNVSKGMAAFGQGTPYGSIRDRPCLIFNINALGQTAAVQKAIDESIRLSQGGAL